MIDGFDLTLTADGDFLTDGLGDFKLISGDDLLAQHIIIRLQNTNPDWFNDEICADLEDLLGMPNEKPTALRGQKMIQDALFTIVDPANLLVEAVPVDRATIIYFVFINIEGAQPMGFEVGLALGSSINVRRVR